MTANALIRDVLGRVTESGLWIPHRYILAAAFTLAVNLSISFLLQPRREPKPCEVEPAEVMDVSVVDLALERILDRPSESSDEVCETLSEAEPAPAMPTVPVPALTTCDAFDSALQLPAMDADTSPDLPLVMPSVQQPAPPSFSAPPVKSEGDYRGPVLIEPPDLSYYYPYSARRRGMSGTTLIRVVIDVSGKVTSAEILQSNPGGVFDAAAQRVGLSLNFRPARRGGKPVPAAVKLNLQWKLD